MKIICISGHARHGKDTVAGMIRSSLERRGERVLVAHYADLVKYVCRTFFDWNGEKDEHGRSLLQYVGTDVVRFQQPDFWVDFIVWMLRFFGDHWDYVLIPDTRFPNEVERLREAGFTVDHLRVQRENFESPLTAEQQKHRSETALDETMPDHLIRNSGSLEDLATLTEQYIEENIYGHE